MCQLLAVGFWFNQQYNTDMYSRDRFVVVFHLATRIPIDDPDYSHSPFHCSLDLQISTVARVHGSFSELLLVILVLVGHGGPASIVAKHLSVGRA